MYRFPLWWQRSGQLSVLVLALVTAPGSATMSGCSSQNAFDGRSREIIKITARRFAYTPGVLRLKRGQPVILELTSVDALHGFNVPQLGARADLVPGQVTRVTLTPDRTGTFVFSCDIFCGTGHDEMMGEIIVVD